VSNKKLDFNIANNPKPQTMKNLLSNRTLQATYGGDDIGGSVVPGKLGAFLFLKGKAKGPVWVKKKARKS